MTSAKITLTPGFYVVGGTMRHDAPSYVERRADRELFDALMQGEFCYVLTARQVGKSSLMIRTAARLRDAGVGVAILDLTAIGRNLIAEQWYGGLLVQIGQRLDLEDELIKFWSSTSVLGPMQKWIEAIRTVVLPRYPNRLVIFIDEIDAVRSLPFSTDELFAGIRECYNRRNEHPEMERLTFCLSGVATPSDLIGDARMTPFNIGCRIELYDFTEAEAAPLTSGLENKEKPSEALLKRILYWTGGHPYLTQRLCQAAASDEGVQSDKGVDRLCEELFFSPRAQERDDNLLFVRERMLRGDTDLAGRLHLYTFIRKGMAISDDETNPQVRNLRLSGIIRTEVGRLKVRNRIYARVFDGAWIRTNMPDAEVRRQRAAYRRGVLRTAIVSALILGVVAGLAIYAIQQANIARQQSADNRRLFYFAQMKFAQPEWEKANVGQVEQLLNSCIPRPGEDDLRSFEWYLFWRRTNSSAFKRDEEHQIASLSVLPDNTTLVISEAVRAKSAGDNEYRIKLYNLASQEVISSFAVPAGSHFDLAVVSPEKRRIAVDGPDSDVGMWDLHSGQRLADYKGLSGGVTAMAFAPDGLLLAAGDLKANVIVWDTETKEEKLTLKNLKQWVKWMAFSHDGRLLATGDESEVVRVWELATGREVKPFNLPGGTFRRFAFFPDGRRLVTSDADGSLHIWDIHERKIVTVLTGHTGEVRSFAVSPNANSLATCGVDRTVRLWDLETGQIVETIRGHRSSLTSVAWSGDGKYLVSGSLDGAIKMWDESASYRAARDQAIATRKLVTECFAAAFLPNSDLIAVGTTLDKRVRIWNLSTGQELSVLEKAEPNILCGTFSRDRRLLATGGEDHEVRIWDVLTGRQIHSFTNHSKPVTSVDFSPDGNLLISGAGDGALWLWDVASGQAVTSLKGDADNSYRAVFSPDGGTIASASRDGSVNLWDATTGKPIRLFVGHTEQVRAIAFSIDGRFLATAGRDRSLRLWDVTTGKELKNLGHSELTTRLAFSLDGKRLATGAENGDVKLWDLTTSQELMTFKGHQNGVSSVIFSADGADLATTGFDGTVWIGRGLETKARYPRIDD